MGDLDEAIREHLELKRRRGADPAEVAREEQEALSPVTRGHAVVTPEALEVAAHREAEQAPRGPSNGGPDRPARPTPDAPGDQDLSDATQEFHVEHGDWLDDDD